MQLRDWPKRFGNNADEYLKVHDRGPSQADVTEGSGGIWERLHYDCSDPNTSSSRRPTPTPSGGASGHTYTNDSCDFGKQIFETYENRGRKPERPFRRVGGAGDLDRNSIPIRDRIGNDLKLLAIHAHVVGRTVAKVLNPDTIVDSGFLVHVSA